VIRMSSPSSETDQNSVLRIQAQSLHPNCWRREVPVMRETLLLLELEAHEFCVDLRAFSRLVLGDLGATVQVLRLAGQEFRPSGEGPSRIHDCVASMGVQACIDAMSGQLMPLSGSPISMLEFWCHSREVARQSERLAEQMVGVDADQAYLVGLCHSIGSLPFVLGWNGTRNRMRDSPSVGAELAREWSLPCCVLTYFQDLQEGRRRSPWSELVTAAHGRVGERSSVCALNETMPTRLLWAV
jgi:HD-like signal output (HDOD) protein